MSIWDCSTLVQIGLVPILVSLPKFLFKILTHEFVCSVLLGLTFFLFLFFTLLTTCVQPTNYTTHKKDNGNE